MTGRQARLRAVPRHSVPRRHALVARHERPGAHAHSNRLAGS